MTTSYKYKLVCPECGADYFVVKKIEEEKEPIYCPFCSSEITEDEE
jgi:DNA-directed RNA polymerase subunit RPC12/RpoP